MNNAVQFQENVPPEEDSLFPLSDVDADFVSDKPVRDTFSDIEDTTSDLSEDENEMHFWVYCVFTTGLFRKMQGLCYILQETTIQ